MGNPLRHGFLRATSLMYRTVRPILFRRPAQQAHEDIMLLCKRLDHSRAARMMLRALHRAAFAENPLPVGGVTLPYGFILAAGLVKGVGFETEDEASYAVEQGENIIPGWRAVPDLLGPVEYGSFTRWPRLGNPGVVVWRDSNTHSTQNRVGLKNPGAVAAATFLSKHKDQLPSVFGINIALSPGITDLAQESQEVLESIQAFVVRGVHPSWFTLNLSCPNTEDDPGNHQTEGKTRMLCGAVVDYLRDTSNENTMQIPLWVKVGPSMHESQYSLLMRIFHETGVRAVIATNTLPCPAPGNPDVLAGVGGGRLHAHAVRAVQILVEARSKHDYTVDVIGCGGVQDHRTYQAFVKHDVAVVQYWSGLVYRGPLIAAYLC